MTFTSTQSREYGEEGNTCLHWSLVYTLQDVNGAYSARACAVPDFLLGRPQ